MANLGELGFLSQFSQEYGAGVQLDNRRIQEDIELLMAVLKTRPQLLTMVLTILEVPAEKMQVSIPVFSELLFKVDGQEMELGVFLKTIGSELARD